MKIVMMVGDKNVTIEKDYDSEEDQSTWIYLMEELIFPALKGFGYIIDDEFIGELDGLHQEYIDKRYRRKHRE